ncbi:hypothetical protein J422_00060 [Methanocaldococcus villosus KIN24-T80]|uniref:Xylose isomerase-like TIM barrel domain-containing protein n=1 Tax=Methanocaldococcus villosus KIN24-T80 TaxID=1069083 RepID=N6UWS9_9EURY|nr:TIM barrel protein [Methanocaldococcus villosus]ENN96799.1 hypothetical protein J422_00060 [Methanocaldococcus villosus KIN24-T80]
MHFGTAGVPLRAKNEFDGAKVLKSFNLDAMELEFVNGIYMNENYAKFLKDLEIIFSAHAPHYINLNAIEKEKVERSIYYIIKSSKVLRHCGRNLVFHPGYYLKKSKDETYKNIRDNIKLILEKIDKNISLRPETAGKIYQFGDIDEILNLCHELNILPCIDFSHIYARSRGKVNSYDDFYKILEKVEDMLGKEAIKDMHIHLTGIEFNKSGEVKHLPLEESDFNYKDVLKALKDFEAEGTVICESPLLEDDAKLLKDYYLTLF